MPVTYTYCPLCGTRVDDTCPAHPDCPTVTEQHHPDDYLTAQQACAYSRAQGGEALSFQSLLQALTILRHENGQVFRATPTGLQRAE
jgi:hypothetical protein